MKKLILLLLLSFCVANVFAQVNTDSLAYQAQRKKINGMLAQRKLKFGQYDSSLNEHTGIFGLQTKKDIRNSNDILMDIVKMDDDILLQTKILLEYRISQQKQVQSHAIETEGSNTAFMNAINKLRDENDGLKKQLDDAVKAQQKSANIAMVAVIGFIVIALLFLRQKFVKKG